MRDPMGGWGFSVTLQSCLTGECYAEPQALNPKPEVLWVLGLKATDHADQSSWANPVRLGIR